MKKIIKICIILMLIMALCGCTRINENIGDMVDPVNVYITSKSTRTGYEGFDYVVYVDVTVHNQGGDGKATVWTSLTQDGNQWSKRQTIYLNGDETRSLTFTYKEISFWGSGGNYRVWVE
jgi:uncharacterized protein YxeA